MDLIKIGKFISSKRKEKDITQSKLAEMLYITDRAVSKWENGICLPDADKMLDLCNFLGISVNELLNGEKIDMKDLNKKTDELLLELAKQEEIKNKKLITNMWVLVTVTLIFYIGILTLACLTLKEGFALGTVICVSTITVVLVAFYALKLEVEAGYYECKECHNKFVPSYLKALMAPHMSTIRYLKCPKCGKRTWAKKVMKK